jgi:peptidoglycan L-alanyl-D-glutamate endopeptidase CwlK
MPLGPYSLSKLQTLQPTVQPIFSSFLAQCEAAGIPCEVVQGTRSFAEQQALYNQGVDNDPTTPKVTNAKPGDSYHQYALALDVVPMAYRNLTDWNPSGPLWERIGQIGEAAGLTWGGRWSNPDKPHFQLTAAPLAELKAYWEKFKQIMPVEITPTSTAIVAALTIAAIFWFVVKPQLERHGIL